MSEFEENGIAQPVATAAAGLCYGVVAEFATPEALLEAARIARGQGYRKLDSYTPFPVHGLDEALGLRRSNLGWIVLGMGLTGATAAVLLQWWTGAVDYPLVIGGKPLFAVEFSMPIIFELAVLFAAIGAVVGMFALNGLPRFHHPVFQHSRIRSATDDGFLLAVENDAKDFDPESAAALLRAAGGSHVEVISQ
jgi:hypothetical protein